jgi:microcystin degradation protein MlrC
MMIAFGSFSHETNTFSVERTDFKRFAPNGLRKGKDLLNYFSGAEEYLGGMIRTAKKEGVELAPLIEATAVGPLITKECLALISGELFEALEKVKGHIDGICLALHGAGCAEGAPDLEAFILKGIRKIVGCHIPITVALDLHGNITPEMASLANGLFGIKEYPHTDCAAAGSRSMEALIGMIKSGKKLYTALVPLPLFISPANASTIKGPMKEVKELVLKAEKEYGLEDAAFFHGFPYQDVQHAGASVTTVSADKELASRAAGELAAAIWDRREAFAVPSLSAKEAVEKAMVSLVKARNEARKGYVVINETSDNPGGGAPCNGTHLLRALMEMHSDKLILAFIHDPEIACKAYNVGKGGRISGLLGGKTDRIHGDPIHLDNAEVLNAGNGEVITVSPMWKGNKLDYGKIARIKAGPVEVMVTEKLAQQVFDDALFKAAGVDLDEYNIVGIKSSNHFRAFFEPLALAIITADPPGIHTGNFSQLPYHNIQRLVFPLNRNVEYSPHVTCYQVRQWRGVGGCFSNAFI